MSVIINIPKIRIDKFKVCCIIMKENWDLTFNQVTEVSVVYRWTEPNNQGEQVILDQACSQQAAVYHLPVLKRLISGTGSVLGYARLKLASWYNSEEEQSNVPHIDL